ncbi:MAG: SMC-Scp complex subunit ScpB [Clostridiaceae bacterium]|nr:SMC-Scp complex subunit ScpB [Clostridia bacterium]MDY3869933.1 SMC-Scp complex subunit ScpB [Clostridiaceae bacterium]
MIEKTTELHELECALEAVLFAAGDSVSEGKLCVVLQTDKATLRNAAQNLGDYYDFNRRGIKLLRLDDRYQLASRADYAQMVRNTLETRKPQNLTPAALEVLAIIAYKQPVTKTYIEQVRGVDSAYTLSSLVDKGLVADCGRLDVPGRPILYQTTETFLRAFGLSSVSQLPALESFGEQDPQQMTLNELEERQDDGPKTAETAGKES